jgi:trans-2,3-dihydro-3-hydroxyanthranilate isomerase
MNFSETTFVLPAEEAHTDMRVRIFTPGDELPMAGHPTIGTAFALARAGVIEHGRTSVVFGLGVGPTDVALTWKGHALGFAWMTQRTPTFSAPMTDRDTAARALRLSSDALAAQLPVQMVSCGVPYVIVPLASREAVDRASLDTSVYDALKAPLGFGREVCVYLFSTEPAADGATAYSRMFGPDIGIGEDPATGSAAGPLGAYLVQHGVVSGEHAGRMMVLQGVKMRRRSEIHVAIDGTAGSIQRVRVGGEAILAGEGILYIGD